jgi:hypothetical protein
LYAGDRLQIGGLVFIVDRSALSTPAVPHRPGEPALHELFRASTRRRLAG